MVVEVDEIDIQISHQCSSTFTVYCGVIWLLNTKCILLCDWCVLFSVFIAFYSKQGKKPP